MTLISTISIGKNCSDGFEKYSVKFRGPGLLSMYLLTVANKHILTKQSNARDRSYISSVTSALGIFSVHYLLYDIY